MCRRPRSVPIRFPGCWFRLCELLYVQISSFGGFPYYVLGFPPDSYNPSSLSSAGFLKLVPITSCESVHLFPSVMAQILRTESNAVGKKSQRNMGFYERMNVHSALQPCHCFQRSVESPEIAITCSCETLDAPVGNQTLSS